MAEDHKEEERGELKNLRSWFSKTTTELKKQSHHIQDDLQYSERIGT